MVTAAAIEMPAAWVGIRWARSSKLPGHFCRDESHAPTDYERPAIQGLSGRACGTCYPPEQGIREGRAEVREWNRTQDEKRQKAAKKGLAA